MGKRERECKFGVCIGNINIGGSVLIYMCLLQVSWEFLAY